MDLFTGWNLPWHEKSFYQLIFATHNHARKLFEPFPGWNFRLRIESFDHQGKLVSRYMSLLDPFEQMRIQMSRQIAAENFGHELLAVKPPSHGRLQSNYFRRIVRCGQSIGQLAQLLAGKLTAVSQLDSKLNHFGLLLRR